MLGSVVYIVGALAILGAQRSSALDAKEANSVCALLSDGTKIYSAIQCDQYYMCTKGKATLQTCPNGEYFSKDAQDCFPQSDVSCGSDDVDPCQGMPDGYFVAVPNSCSEYYYCEGGVGAKSSCSKGLNFDQKGQACKYQSEYPCTESGKDDGEGVINLCQVVPTGIYFGSALSCKSWQKCSSSGPPEMSDCPDDYVFNVDTRECDFKENTSCRQLKGDPETEKPSLEGTPCSKNNEVISDKTCTGFYVCTNNIYISGKCINGNYLDTKDFKCKNRLDAINDCDRCEGTRLEFVNLYGDNNCTTYGYCKNGKMQSTGVCTKGHFNELAGACETNGKNPKFPVCYVPDDETDPSTVPPTEESSTPAESDTTTAESSTTPKESTPKPTEPEETEETDTTTKRTRRTTTTTEASTTEETSATEPEDSEVKKDSEKNPKEPESGEENTDKET